MTYRPMYLGHVNIYVRDAERSQKWYEEVLGWLDRWTAEELGNGEGQSNEFLAVN